MDLNFNAPMYRDFANLDADEFDNSDTEAYFEVDHEAEAAVSARIKTDVRLEPVPSSPALKENPRTAPKNLVMGVQTLMRAGERPAGLRDVTNSPLATAPRARTPLKRANAVGSQDEPRAKQSRAESEPRSPAAAVGRGQPDGKDSPPAGRRSRLPTPSRGRSVDTAATRASPRLAARRPATPELSSRGAAPRAGGRRRSVSAAAAPPLPPRRPTPGAAGAARRRTPASSPAPARPAPATRQTAVRRAPSAGAPAARRTPSTGGRRRSLSQNDAARAAAGPSKLVVSETPNVLRRGLQLRSAARAAAEKAVKQEQQDRLDTLRKQMADYKKKAAESKKQPVRPRTAAVKPPTRPQPFHLHGDRQTGGAATRPAAEFKSMAQMMDGFNRKTPPRFHTRPAGERPTCGAGTASPHVTIGHTPSLMTHARTRSMNHVPSREQIEQAELEEARQHQVRARPVNRRLLEQTVGVPAKQARPATAVEPFHLTQTAPKTTAAADETAAPAPGFHARPAPRAILEAPQGVPTRQAPPATRPQSPALQLKQRMAERRRQVQEERETSGVVRANPLPDVGVPFLPRVEHRATRPSPFSFETRDKLRLAEKERKIQQVHEEERRQREFRAQLLPPLSPRGVPERRVPAATRPQPFQLPGDQQTAAAAVRRQKKREEEDAAQRSAASFQAQPCTVTQREPFQLRPATRGTTAPKTPQLHTNTRSARRQSFEQRQKQREAELGAALEEAERQRQLQQEEEEARHRREAVHCAQPVRHYRPVHVLPSDAPITTPRSPNWAIHGSRASHRSE